jgi:hypothetical protein
VQEGEDALKEKKMEHEFGVEIVRTFGARLRRIYEPDQQGLPTQMAESLERLKCAEETRRYAGQPSESKSQESGSLDGGSMAFMPSAAPATR